MKWRKSEELMWGREVVFVDRDWHIGTGEVIRDDQILCIKELVHIAGITRVVHVHNIRGWMDHGDFEWPKEFVETVKDGSWTDHTCWARDGILSTGPGSVEESIRESQARACGKGWKPE